MKRKLTGLRLLRSGSPKIVSFRVCSTMAIKNKLSILIADLMLKPWKFRKANWIPSAMASTTIKIKNSTMPS